MLIRRKSDNKYKGVLYIMNKRVKIVATLGPAVEIRGGKKFGEDGYWSEKLDPDASAKNIAQLIE